jgi:hypothetical protein
MEGPLKTSLRVLLAIAAQAFIFHHLVLLHGWFTPLFHLYALVLMPLRMRPIVYLLVGGFIGLGVDLINFGGGLFTAAGLVSGGLQPLVARLLSPREGYEVDAEPGPKNLGWSWWIAFTFLIIWGHSIWLFCIEAGRWGLLPRALGQATTSAIGTTILVLIVRSLFVQNGDRR